MSHVASTLGRDPDIEIHSFRHRCSFEQYGVFAKQGKPHIITTERTIILMFYVQSFKFNICDFTLQNWDYIEGAVCDPILC